MLYRYNRTIRTPVDLDGAYSGGCILAGGSPTLAQEDLRSVEQPGVMVMSMNNTALTIQSDFWVGADKPLCYSEVILRDPKLMKFMMISRKNFELDPGLRLKDLPNMYFFGAHENFTVNNLLKADRDYVWWKNTFFVAIQLLYRLGFRQIYLAGCQFKIGVDKPYSYDVKLTDGEVKWNQKLYGYTVSQMKQLKPHFEEKGLQVYSCTPDSPLNDIYPTMSFDEAVNSMRLEMPNNLDKCVHSSFFKREVTTNG